MCGHAVSDAAFEDLDQEPLEIVHLGLLMELELVVPFSLLQRVVLKRHWYISTTPVLQEF